MSEYVDTKLINCNRLASVESRTGNNSNPAVFTNPLNETIRLDVGDKVSIERAFVNEVGAGNSQTIEFKGQSRGSNKVATYTDIQYNEKYYKKSNTYDPKYRLGYYRSITTTEVENDSVDLRDNLAPLVFGYFITNNEYPNYVQQPRRYASNLFGRGSVLRNTPTSFTERDSQTDGLPLSRFTINNECVCFADYRKREDANDVVYFKQRVDNTRYTLFIKDKIAYSVGATHDKDQFPKNYHNGIFSEARYYRVRDKLDIKVNKGFNTPSAVAEQITQQLTETKNEDIFEILDSDSFVRPLTKTIETNTFKPINAQNVYNFSPQSYNAYVAQALPVTDANVSQDSIDYIATFGYIGVKRPEIFEAGRKMHKLLNVGANMPTIYNSAGVLIAEELDDFEGFTTVGARPVATAQTVNQDTFFTLNVLYTEANLKIIRDFFDSQALYPELWEGLENTTYYSDTNVGTLTQPTIANSRFFHMNKYTTDTGTAIHNETFGDDAFTQRVPPNDVEMSSAPVFFNYDDSKRDDFIEPEQYNDANGLMYGGFVPVRITQHDADGSNARAMYLIGIKNNAIGGTPRKLFTDAIVPANPEFKTIGNGRRLGFDFHSTAYSTAIITPYSGYGNTDIGVSATENDGSKGTDLTYAYPTQINWIRSIATTTSMIDLNPYMTMSYIGANNPAINYNNVTNRFELKRFHTGNNTGNKNSAGNPSSIINNKSLTPSNRETERNIAPAQENQEAGNTVYKINPRPPQFGFSPTFKPYTRNDQAYRVQPYPETATELLDSQTHLRGVNTIKYDAYNINIEPYKIFDSHGGIYIENWGFDEDNWEDNLWDILGFDYSAVNAKASSKNVLTKRVDNENSNLLYRPTTNAEVVQTDTKNYVTNQFGAVMYYNQLPYPTCVPYYISKHGNGINQFFYVNGNSFTAEAATPLELWNEVAVLTESTTITATDLQKSVLRPYYTIRSDILEGATAIGGNPTGANLPIISIVDKYSAASDYFLGNPSDIQFTVTKPTMIADITTSIHDSDGEYANVDKTSSVIYKIQKVRRTPVGLIQEILGDGEKEKK